MQEIHLLTSGWNYFLNMSYKSKPCFKNIVLNDGNVLEVIFYKLQAEEFKLPISLDSYFKPNLHIWQFLQRWNKLERNCQSGTASSKVWMLIWFNLMVQVLFCVAPNIKPSNTQGFTEDCDWIPQRSSDPNHSHTSLRYGIYIVQKRRCDGMINKRADRRRLQAAVGRNQLSHKQTYRGVGINSMNNNSNV